MDAVTRANAFQFVEFGEPGAARAGGSRAAAHVQLRNALYEARYYARSPAAYEGGRSRESQLMRLDAAALAPVLEGEQPGSASSGDRVGGDVWFAVRTVALKANSIGKVEEKTKIEL